MVIQKQDKNVYGVYSIFFAEPCGMTLPKRDSKYFAQISDSPVSEVVAVIRLYKLCSKKNVLNKNGVRVKLPPTPNALFRRWQQIVALATELGYLYDN